MEKGWRIDQVTETGGRIRRSRRRKEEKIRSMDNQEREREQRRPEMYGEKDGEVMRGKNRWMAGRMEVGKKGMWKRERNNEEGRRKERKGK